MYIAEALVQSAVGLVIDVLQLNKKHIQAQVHTHKRRRTPKCKQNHRRTSTQLHKYIQDTGNKSEGCPRKKYPPDVFVCGQRPHHKKI